MGKDQDGDIYPYTHHSKAQPNLKNSGFRNRSLRKHRGAKRQSGPTTEAKTSIPNNQRGSFGRTPTKGRQSQNNIYDMSQYA